MKKLIIHLGFIYLLIGIPLYSFCSESVFLSSSNQLIPGTNITFDESIPGKITINASGSGSALPSGVIAMWSGLLSNIPSGWKLCDGTNGTPDLRDKFIKGTSAGENPGSTGGSSTYTPQGTVSQPIFTGNLLASHSHGIGTYGNTAISAGTPSGTISQPTFTGNALGTHLHGVGTYANTGISAGTPSGTVAWPAGVPTFAGSALATHAHELPFIKVAGGTGVLRMLASSIFGTGTSRTPESVSAAPTANTTAAAVELSQAVSGGTPVGTVAWPAGVPTFSGSALASHNHVFSGSSEAISAGTPAGTVSQPSFTGNALANHNHVFSGLSESLSAGTPSGTVSQSTFTGTQATVEPTYYKLAFIMKL